MPTPFTPHCRVLLQGAERERIACYLECDPRLVAGARLRFVQRDIDPKGQIWTVVKVYQDGVSKTPRYRVVYL